ncbi:unnamed protein product [Clonostachys byssicola]|uniref:Uncharacterized protein n=1 Tax=Clonostachys byssicola TaxID=160290 RepID=A0A9N9UA55_9HYPO|nr:unnamed protein product [Clonostachys byssicola]
MSISKVPPELFALILGQLDSPQALHCAISASPLIFQAFTASRIQILISVFHRAILPGARKGALAIIQCPSVSTEDQLDELWQFLDTHFHPGQATLPFPRDNPAITVLMRLVTRVLRLEQDYFNDTMSNLADAPGGDASERKQLESPTPLSDAERTRIQGAFLRLELYCRCFPVVQDDLGMEVPPGEDDIGMQVSLVPAELQFQHFLHQLQPWEVEEMSCVHQYLSFRIGPLIEQIQNEIVAIAFRHQVQGPRPKCSKDNAQVWMMGKWIPYTGPTFEIPSPESEGLPNSLPSYEPHELRTFSYWRGSPIFEMEGRQEFYEFLSSLVSRGLEYLVSVFDADKELQRYLLLSGEYTLREFLPEAITYAIENDIRSDPHPQTQGLLTQLESAAPDSLTDDPVRAGLDETAVQARISYSLENCHDEQERFDFKEKASAEEVLMEVEIPKSVMDDLNRTYGFWERTSVTEENM